MQVVSMDRVLIELQQNDSHFGRTTEVRTAEQQNGRMMEAATSDELRPLPYQAPPRARGVETRQPSVGPLRMQ